MANFTVGQASAVRDVLRYLERAAAGKTDDDIYTADRAADALALLANAAQARMLAGPGPLEAREAIGALADKLAAADATTDRWAALYPDGSWTSGEDGNRQEAQEIVDANPECVLVVRQESEWTTVRVLEADRG